MYFKIQSTLLTGLFTVLINLELIRSQHEGDLRWGYSHVDGPSVWCEVLHEGQCCSQLSQSPIDISTDGLKFMSEQLLFFNYNATGKRVVLANNGRTVVVHMFESRKLPHIRMGSRKLRFGLDSLHFHWGSQDNNGSEHSIDGHRYPMEMHLVHVNEKYNSLEEAKQYADGIAVLAVFLQISNKTNSNYAKLTKSLSKVKKEGDHVDIKQTFAIDSLLPPALDTVYAYRGSLTTPPCSEAVTWFVVDRANTISEEQMAAFRQLRTTVKPLTNSSEQIELADNFRPQQQLHQRLIFKMKANLRS